MPDDLTEAVGCPIDGRQQSDNGMRLMHLAQNQLHETIIDLNVP